MRIHTRHLLAVLAAALMLAVGVTSTAANRLSVSNQRFRLVWSALTFTGGGFEASCAVTLEGSFHSSTLAKVSGALIGHVSRASLASCRGTGEQTRFNTEALPWHVRYSSFAGTLPSITSVKTSLDGMEIWNWIGGFWCHYRTPWLSSLTIGAGGAITGVRSDETTALQAAADNSPFCPASITAAGTGTVTLLGATTAITVRLI